MPPLFSIIVPTYDRARMLRTALSTVRCQTLTDWECFVVDDGSTDGTPQVMDAFAPDKRFRMIRSPRNQGMNASRNLALKEARGRFITFLDSDDLWLSERLRAFWERAEADPAAGFLFSNAYILRYDRIVGTLFDPRRPIPEGVVPGHYAVGDQQLPYVTTNVAIRRDAFDRWGMFKTEMKTLDTELFARFLAGGLPVAVLRQPLSVRRLHEGQLTVRYSENFEESMLAMASSRASAEETRRRRVQVAGEVALYLIKSARPGEARRFLSETLADGEGSARIRLLTYVPAGLLSILKALRSRWLRLRFYPGWAPADYQAVLASIRPLLGAEEA